MSELKPCPFCGEQVFTPLVASLDDGYTRCGLCGAKMQHRRWQTRPIEDDLRKRIAELSQAVGLITTLKPTMVMDTEHPLDMAKEVEAYVTVRIAELEAENERLSQLLHDEMSQLEIATDLGNKRCAALNKIYEDGEKHNTNWCKRIAQEGLGIKNA